MNDKEMESFLDNIAEQVLDEDKIVTYKSLSRSLGIHVNTAKQLLYTFLINEKSKTSFTISATYLIAGKKVDGSFNISIVNEADLKNEYSTFSEVTSEHVYSVQKGKNLKDLILLCGINKESSNTESFKVVIKCPKAVCKATGEVKKKSDFCQESNKNIIKQALMSDTQAVSTPETNKKYEIATNKELELKSPKKTSPKGNQQKSQGAIKIPAGNIANMFAKVAQKNAEKTTEKPDKSTSKERPKKVKVDVDVTEEDNVEPEKSEKQTSKNRSESRESSKRKKKGSKRKRIQLLSDSEENDSNNDEEEGKEKTINQEDDDFLPCSLNLEEEKEEVKKLIPCNTRKKRKVIDKTVMNEDGYLETKKEIVFETDSENEVDVVMTTLKERNKEVEPSNAKRKGTQGAGTSKKQSSLLTFFKKN